MVEDTVVVAMEASQGWLRIPWWWQWRPSYGSCGGHGGGDSDV